MLVEDKHQMEQPTILKTKESFPKDNVNQMTMIHHKIDSLIQHNVVSSFNEFRV